MYRCTVPRTEKDSRGGDNEGTARDEEDWVRESRLYFIHACLRTEDRVEEVLPKLPNRTSITHTWWCVTVYLEEICHMTSPTVT